MPKILCVCFEASDSVKLAGFARALGGDAEFVSVPSGGLSDSAATAIATAATGFTHVAALSSMAAKDALARVAGLLDAAMVTDVLSVVAPNRFTRPMVAGSVIATVETLSEPVVLTVRAAGFADGDSPAVRSLDLPPSKATQVSVSERSVGRPDLGQAKIVVSGGRPLRDAETFERVLGGFADKIGAAVGATRAAVDSGIAANELQVGQTGKIVAPDLYIAAGISGSTQHVAGIKDSKLIVAINKDPDAPIFDVADLGLVADLFEALPAIESRL